ncbi:MAG TPA: hypothetical protein VF841_06880 [Anaeromyxobacter sp.]
MSAGRRALRGRALLLALAAASCGPYANVAQKLDVTARVAGDTWIANGGPDEVRILIVGKPSAEGTAPFSFSSVYEPISAGTSVSTLQGTWVEVGTAGAATLDVEHSYSYPDESTVPILQRNGTTRSDDRFPIQVTVARSAGRLAVSGDARVAGTYVALTEALGHLGTAAPSDAACAFHVANLALLRSQGRIIGFGGAGILQYQQAETYIGTVAGTVEISMSGFTSNTTTLQYAGFEDIGGVVVDGPMKTDANSSGDGHMYGRMTFAFSPIAADGTAGTPITGWIDYGGDATPLGPNDPTNAIQISYGNPVGGHYIVAIDPAGVGGTAQVGPQDPPSPSVSQCLALP